MPCSSPTSFTGVSMQSTAIYNSLTFIPAIVPGAAPQITRKRHMGRVGTRFAVLLLLLVKALYGMPDSADRDICGICMSGAECPLLRNSDEEHDLVAPSKVLDALC